MTMDTQFVIGEKRQKRINSFDAVDNMSPELRQCVHEYGYAIVQACLLAGVRAPHRIHQLVKEIWNGARQPTQKRKKGNTLDWLLLQAECPLNADTLRRVLHSEGYLIVPREPTRAMINASLKEVSGFIVRCTKEEKHRRRLAAALRVIEAQTLAEMARDH